MSGASTTSLIYEGPQALIVELEREVNSGDVVLDVDDALVSKLVQVMGIREATKAEEKKGRKEAEDAAKAAEESDATDQHESAKAPSESTGGSSPEQAGESS